MMIIKNYETNIENEVYGIYWIDGIRYQFVIPYDGYEGFLAISEDECDIIDPKIDKFIYMKSDSGIDMLIHIAAYEGNLIYGLIDHDADSMKKFIINLKKLQ